jgi:hypothetical protein
MRAERGDDGIGIGEGAGGTLPFEQQAVFGAGERQASAAQAALLAGADGNGEAGRGLGDAFAERGGIEAPRGAAASAGARGDMGARIGRTRR